MVGQKNLTLSAGQPSRLDEIDLAPLSNVFGLRVKYSVFDAQNQQLHYDEQSYISVQQKVNQNARESNKPILIQTDRAIYKPGAIVKYRVVVVDGPKLLPTNGTVTTKIYDATRNLIQKRSRVPLRLGVASGELELSEEPPHRLLEPGGTT